MTDELRPGLEEAGLSAIEANVLDGVTGKRREAGDDEVVADDLVQRMAATLVRRRCNQHACQGTLDHPCQHPAHARDVDYLGHCLAFLGLPGAYEPPTEQERAHLLTNLPTVLPLLTNKPNA